MESFKISGRTVTLYPCAEAGKPIIYLNIFSETADEIYRTLKNTCRSDFTLAAVSVSDWYSDMSPWESPPISKNDTPCSGGADKYLKLLTEEIVPRTEEVTQKISWRGIAGYSLAGLFALYSLYRTDIFTRAASISGSLWFPKFKKYVFENEMKARPDFLYFSLGDTECRTKNPYLKTVRENTEEIEAFYRKKGIDTSFKLNEGNHFNNADGRTADGIARMLEF